MENLEILHAKHEDEFNRQVEFMISGDIDETLSNAEFKNLLDPENPEDMLEELTGRVGRSLRLHPWIGLVSPGVSRDFAGTFAGTSSGPGPTSP